MKLFSSTADLSYDINRKQQRGVLSEIHIADIHFGSIDPKTEYNILKKELINELHRVPIIDLIYIEGDLFERKYTTDSEPILYALLFMADIRLLAIEKNATVIVLGGTESHDAGQLNLLYPYLEDPLFDIRIVENIRFEYAKGARILCIPELYGIHESVYQKFLFESGIYDRCVMHGTIEGAVYGNTINKRGRLFGIDDFGNCRGPIISGHIHIAGCYNSHFYYPGCPIRYKFGEEQEKGVMLIYYNLDTCDYYPHLIPIKSFKYETINIDELMTQDPKDIIDYVDKIKKEDNIDYLRITYGKEVQSDSIAVIRDYYKNNGKIKIKLKEERVSSIVADDSNKYTEYAYLFDDNINPYDKLAIYINEQEKCQFITGDEIKKLMEEDF